MDSVTFDEELTVLPGAPEFGESLDFASAGLVFRSGSGTIRDLKDETYDPTMKTHVIIAQSTKYSTAIVPDEITPRLKPTVRVLNGTAVLLPNKWLPCLRIADKDYYGRRSTLIIPHDQLIRDQPLAFSVRNFLEEGKRPMQVYSYGPTTPSSAIGIFASSDAMHTRNRAFAKCPAEIIIREPFFSYHVISFDRWLPTSFLMLQSETSDPNTDSISFLFTPPIPLVLMSSLPIGAFDETHVASTSSLFDLAIDEDDDTLAAADYCPPPLSLKRRYVDASPVVHIARPLRARPSIAVNSLPVNSISHTFFLPGEEGRDIFQDTFSIPQRRMRRATITFDEAGCAHVKPRE